MAGHASSISRIMIPINSSGTTPAAPTTSARKTRSPMSNPLPRTRGAVGARSATAIAGDLQARQRWLAVDGDLLDELFALGGQAVWHDCVGQVLVELLPIVRRPPQQP